MVWLVEDKEATERRIRDSILELCRLNLDRTEGAGTSSAYEVDGIICITAHNEDGETDNSEQLVIKLHELLPGRGRHEHQQSSQRSFRGAEPSLLRGYLSAKRGSLLMGAHGAISRQQQHQQMLPVHCLNEKRKIIDENDNAVLAPVKRMMVFANPVAENLSRFKTTSIVNGRRDPVVTSIYDDDDVLDLHKKGSTPDYRDPRAGNITSYVSGSPCEPCSLNFQSTSTPRNYESENNGLETVSTEAYLIEPRNNEESTPLVKVKVEVEDGCAACLSGGGESVCDRHQGVTGITDSTGTILNRRKQIKPKRGVALEDHQGGDSLLNTRGDVDVLLDAEWSGCPDAATRNVSPISLSIKEKETAVNGMLGPVDESAMMKEGSTDIIRSLLQRKQSPSGSTSATPFECWSDGAGRRGTSGGSVSVHSNRSSLFERPSPRYGMPRLHRGYIPRRSPDSTASPSSPFPYQDVRAEGMKGGVNDCVSAASWSCPHCSEELHGFEAFSAHCRTIHKRHACPYCLQTFTQRVNRDRHLYNHTGLNQDFISNILKNFNEHFDIK